MEELQQFADNYTSKDFDRIKFDWNGKHGDDFFDPNYDFRMRLSTFLLPQLKEANVQLLRDLYVEIGKSSKVTFSIYSNFHLLAQELISRDWKENLIWYMKGAAQSADAYMSSARIVIDQEVAIDIYE